MPVDNDDLGNEKDKDDDEDQVKEYSNEDNGVNDNLNKS